MSMEEQMKTAVALVEQIQLDATAAAIAGTWPTAYFLHQEDFDLVYDWLSAKAGPVMHGKPAFESRYFKLSTVAGLVVVRPSAEVSRGSFQRTYSRALGVLDPNTAAPIGPPRTMTVHGKFRVYFNRHGAEPLMWCISPESGLWELAVRDVQIATEARTVYRKKETADEDDGRPSAWIAVEGALTLLDHGHATIGAL